MKYVYILGGVLVVIAAVGYFWKDIAIVSEPITSTSSATLTALSKDVYLKRFAGDVETETVSIATPVANKDQIKTSAEGRAILTQGNDILTSLDNNTSLTVAIGEQGKKTRSELVAGQTWSKVERSLEQDEVYEVYTPTMVAAVRGTSFGVSTDPTKALVVSEGTVVAQGRDEFGTVSSSTVIVEAGNTLEIIEGILTIRETTDTDRDEWYFEHNDKDEEEPAVAIPAPPAPIIEEQPEIIACTADAKQCPDGSFVSRVGPNCEFAACPVVDEIECTDEALTCPDGSTVGRIGPNCEFAACPLIEEPELDPLSITDIDPIQFFYPDENRIVIRGTGLDRVDTILFDDMSVAFEMSSQGVLGVRVSELDEDSEIYDVTLKAGEESITRTDAVEVLEPEEIIEESLLRIDEITSGLEDSMEFVIVRGPGMDLVETVLVNGDDVLEFGLFSDTELHIFDTFLQSVSEVTVSGAGLSDTATP